ncbi:MAG: hypothetical protein H6Q58_181 [Firmicutes bacterium]|nr:hypothetical protein [Bacillota bacterium]
METKQVLEIALSSGQILLKNGAETYRVEETIERICAAYDLQCECITTAKGVMVSVLDSSGEKMTSLKKVRNAGVDLYRIELINSFSRDFKKNSMDYDEAVKMLKGIENAPEFSLPVRILAASMTSFVYSLFFNGTIYDSIAAAAISVFIYFMMEKVSKLGFFQFFEFFFSGFIIGMASIAAEGMLPILSKGSIITGAIMILLPGVPLTNGIKDIIYGDFTSGFTKFGEAMLIITAVGAGIGAALTVGTGVKP